ncbi:MAG: glycosyltransferase family 2 protein [Herbiconiux sp.]|nr:MAG: glycosyltransferase family 2 protein [Herbiconiux sp.]
MTATPKVSVVIPAYNNADFIAETIESVLAQTFTDFELIIADHSSTDDTKAIIERYADDPRVTILTTPAGGGAPRNWNRVTEAAQGEYIKLVCGDDLVYPDNLRLQLQAIETDPSVTMVASPRDIIDARGAVVISNRGLGGLTGTTPGAAAVRRTVAAGTNLFGEPGCVLIRRSTLVEIGLWDPRFPYLIDEATYARVLLQGSLVTVDVPLAAFRLSDTQWSVELAQEQSSQAAAFHRWVRVEHPDVVSARDVAIGNARAAVLARLRRIVYWRLRARMKVTV